MISGHFPAAIFTLLIITNLSNAQFESYINHACSDNTGNYTTNSTYSSNLNSLLTTISTNNDITYGFYNSSAGVEPDKVSVIALCRGDISLNACRSCVNFSISDIVQRCPVQKEAIIWYDHCMLRYSNRSIFAKIGVPNYFSRWVQDARDIEIFNKHLYKLMYSLRDEAAAGNSTRKFAVGRSNSTEFGVLYGLVQCTPDLSYLSCGTCLDWIFTYMDKYLAGNQRGSSYGPSCGFRYSLEQFYESPDGAPAPSAIAPPQLPQGSKSDTAQAKGPAHSDMGAHDKIRRGARQRIPSHTYPVEQFVNVTQAPVKVVSNGMTRWNQCSTGVCYVSENLE